MFGIWRSLGPQLDGAISDEVLWHDVDSDAAAPHGAAAPPMAQIAAHSPLRGLEVSSHLRRQCFIAEERWDGCSGYNARVAKDMNRVKLAILPQEEKWKRMMTEIGGDAKIRDVWRMSELLEICPKEV